MTAPADHLTFLQASCHGPTLDRRSVRFALAHRADVVKFSEAYAHDLPAFLQERPRWRATMPAPSPADNRDDERGKFDCPVLVRRTFPLVEEWSKQMCHRSVPLKLAPPRWANGQAVVTPLGVVENIAMHPHADIKGHPEELPRVVEYRRSMQRLEHRIGQALDEGRLIHFSGDLNYPETKHGPNWAPRAVFDRLGLKTWAVGVDWMAWSPELVLVDKRVIPTAVNHQDHPWLLARYTGFVDA